MYLLQALRKVSGISLSLYSYGPFDSDVLSDLGTAEDLGAVDLWRSPIRGDMVIDKAGKDR